jgi:hypothetical protein
MKPSRTAAEEHVPGKYGEDSNFPLCSLPPTIAAMVQAIAAVHGVPAVMPAAIALSMIAAAIGKGLLIASGKGRRTMGNLYFLVSAESGTCKSTSLGILLEPFETIQANLKEFAGVHGSTTPSPTHSTEENGGCDGFEGLVPMPDNDVSSEKSAEEDSKRLTCSNVTGLSLAKLLAENRETTFNVNPEAGNLLKQVSKLASPLGELLLKGFSGDSVEIDRMNRKPVVLAKPCITVCWLCQPHRLDQFLASDHLMEDGLLPRFLVSHSKAGMAFMTEDDNAIPVDVSDGYRAVIHTLFENYGQRSGKPLTAQTSPEAFEILRAYHNHNAERWHAEEGPLRCCIARWTEQAWKITLVLHAATHGRDSDRVAVERETAERAVALQEWFSKQQESIIRGTTQPPEGKRLEKLCRLLSKAPNHEIKLRDLQNSHGFSSEEVRRMVELAPSQLDLQERKNPRGGPHSPVLVVINASS